MYRLIMLIMVPAYFTATAQQDFNFKMVEDSSYSLYMKGRWKALESFGREAIAHHVDYYYLRYRMGVAFYSQQKYQLAAAHFERAYLFNSSDDLLKEYLFYSYVFTDRYNEALRLSVHFGDSLRVATKTRKPAPVNFVTAEGGVKLNNQPNLLSPLYYGEAGFNHLLGRGASMYHSLGYVTQPYYYGTYHQLQYYVAAGIPLKKGFALNPAFSVLYSSFTNSLDTKLNRSEFYFIGSLNVSKVMPYIKMALANSFSNLDTSYQVEHTLALTVYPLANQKFSIGATGILLSGNWYKKVSPLLQLSARFNFPAFFALSAVYTHGGAYNYNLYNGSLVQDGYDLNKENITVVPEFIIKKMYSIYLVYQLELKTERTTGTGYMNNGFSIGTKIKI